jgi:membrane protein
MKGLLLYKSSREIMNIQIVRYIAESATTSGLENLYYVVTIIGTLIVIVGALGALYRYATATPLDKLMMEGIDRVGAKIFPLFGGFVCVVVFNLIIEVLLFSVKESREEWGLNYDNIMAIIRCSLKLIVQAGWFYLILCITRIIIERIVTTKRIGILTKRLEIIISIMASGIAINFVNECIPFKALFMSIVSGTIIFLAKMEVRYVRKVWAYMAIFIMAPYVSFCCVAPFKGTGTAIIPLLLVSLFEMIFLDQTYREFFLENLQKKGIRISCRDSDFRVDTIMNDESLEARETYECYEIKDGYIFCGKIKDEGNAKRIRVISLETLQKNEIPLEYYDVD